MVNSRLYEALIDHQQQTSAEAESVHLNTKVSFFQTPGFGVENHPVIQ